MRQDVKDLIELQGATREFFQSLLAFGVPQDYAFDCRLIASELLANALKHSGCAATLKWLVTAQTIELWVSSPVRFEPPVESHCSNIDAESGRGLFLVDQFSFERTVTDEGAIKVTVKF